MKQPKQQIHKCSKKQKRTARTAISCLMLLLLYGCAYEGPVTPPVTVVSADDDGESIAQKTGDVLLGDETDASHTDAQNSCTSSSRGMEILTVFVCGAVKAPGVYELPAGSRVYEAIALAGGTTDEAAQTAVNQAELLCDGQMIEIPTR